MKKKFMAVLLIFVMAALAACSGARDGGSAKGEKGRYVQEARALPEGEEYIQAMRVLEDGTIRLVGDGRIYDSEDNGATWKEADYGSEILKEIRENDHIEMSAATLAKDGSVFFVYTRFLDEDYMETENWDYESKYVLIDSDGKETDVKIELPEAEEGDYGWSEEENVISAEEDPETEEESDDEEEEEDDGEPAPREMYRMELVGDGTVLGYDWGNTLFHVDLSTGNIIKELKVSEDQDINTFSVHDGKAYLMTWNDFKVYDLKNGDETDVPAGIAAFFEEGRDYGGSDDYQLLFDDEQNVVYIVDMTTGIYRLADGGEKEAELLLDGSSTSLTNPEVYMQHIIVLKDETFLANYSRYDDDEANGLYFYSWSETAEGPELELRIFSIRENQDIEQAAATFQEQNPKYSVKYEYAMDWESSLSLSEILKNLNTEILAGNGPDIIILDDMPVDTYVETGILEDISDVVNTAKEKSKYFDNILDTYKYDSGLYGVPMKFTVPIMMAKADEMEGITDLKSLADYTVQKREEKKEYLNIIGDHYGESVSSLMLEVSGNSLVKEDGTLDEAQLKEFVEQTKRIYDHNTKSIYESGGEGGSADGYEDGEVNTDFTYMSEGYMDLTGMGVLYALNDMEPMITGHIMSMDELNVMFGIEKELGWKWTALPGMDSGVYSTNTSLGVNAKGEHIEEAKAFVSFMLSAERQGRESWGSGFPVSMTAFEDTCEDYLSGEKEPGGHGYSASMEDGTDLEGEVNGRIATREEYEEVRDLFASLDTPTIQNATIITAIRSEIEKCFFGETNTDETVENILKKVNLYLSE